MNRMTYDEFCEYAKENLLDYLPEVEDGRVEIKDTVKNNGIKIRTLRVFDPIYNVTPNLYLEDYYKAYLSGAEMKDILDKMANMYVSTRDNIKFDEEEILNYERVKDKIILRLVNYDYNKEMLEHAPYVRWHDLAVTFRWLVDNNNRGIASSLVTNKEVDYWGVKVDDMYEQALENTYKMFPSECDEMLDFFKENMLLEPGCLDGIDPVMMEVMANQQEVKMYILTNNMKLNGATALLYPAALQELSKKMGGNFYILPSSVHEIIAVTDAGIEADEETLSEMVCETNNTIVERKEILSYHVYYYDASEDQVKIVA